MNIEQAIDSVYGFFKTVWDANGGGVEVFYDATPENDSPDDNATTNLVTPHLVVSADYENTFQSSMGSTGNRRFRRQGSLIVQIRTPRKQGRLTEDQLATIIFDNMEGECTPEGVVFWRIIPLRGFTVGAFRVKQLVIEFEYDEIK